jgi:predicted transglutaminase-like cysteine proteinase
MILEDAHWSDPTSLEVFGRIVDRIRMLRVLLAVTYRLEFEPPWIGRWQVTTLTIKRLGEREVSATIDRVVGNKLISASIRQDIIERTDGTGYWCISAIRRRMRVRRRPAMLGACVHSTSAVAPPSLYRAEAREQEGLAMLGHLNRAINLSITPFEPIEWLTGLDAINADGDCTTYATAKYFALREAGIATNRVRVVIVHERNRRVRGFERDAGSFPAVSGMAWRSSSRRVTPMDLPSVPAPSRKAARYR